MREIITLIVIAVFLIGVLIGFVLKEGWKVNSDRDKPGSNYINYDYIEKVGHPECCPLRKVEMFFDEPPVIYCAKGDDTIVFSDCHKCDAFKHKDSVNKSWNDKKKQIIAIDKDGKEFLDWAYHHGWNTNDSEELNEAFERYRKYRSQTKFDMWDSIKPWINCKHKALVNAGIPGVKTLKCCASVDQKQGRDDCKTCGLNIDAKDPKKVDSWNEFPKCSLMKQTFYSDTAYNKFVLCDLKKSKVTLKECLCCEHSVSNDQTAKADAGKAKLSLVPQKINYAIARVREYGNNKYPKGGKDNWKSVEKQRYVDAMLRHISAYISDPEGVDEESGLPHLWHAACDMAFILEKEDE